MKLLNFFHRKPRQNTPEHAFGLDIAASSLKLLDLAKSSDIIEVTSFKEVRLPPGVIEDYKLVLYEEFQKRLSEAVHHGVPRPFSSRSVVVGLPDAKAFLHSFPVAKDVATDDHLTSWLREQAQKTIPFEPSEIYDDYSIISDGGEEQLAIYVAFPKEILDGFRKALLGINLEPAAFEIGSLALVRALLTREESASTIALIDCGEQTTTLSIFDRGGLRSTSNIELGGILFTREIAATLKVDLESAERIKRSYGFQDNSRTGKHNPALEALVALGATLVEEIQRALDYYQDQVRARPKMIIITGGSSLIPGFANFLEQKLKLPVRERSPKDIYQVSLPRLSEKILMADSELDRYAIAFGLSLRGLDKVSIDSGMSLGAETPDSEIKQQG